MDSLVGKGWKSGNRAGSSFVTSQLDTNTATGTQVRIAAIGDFHLRAHVPDPIRAALLELAAAADVVILTGDLTENGRLPEVEAVTALTSEIETPIFAVLGNHDRRSVRRREFRRTLATGGVTLLDGDSTIMELDNGLRIGLVGIGGYGGGFWPDEAPDLISTRLSQAVAIRARREASRLESALEALRHQPRDLTIVTMHYAPTTSTLGHEPPTKHWMLGNSILGRVVDRHEVSLVLHGHAHLGNYRGETPGGTPVRNVALPVVQGPVMLLLGIDGDVWDDPRLANLPPQDRIVTSTAYPRAE